VVLDRIRFLERVAEAPPSHGAVGNAGNVCDARLGPRGLRPIPKRVGLRFDAGRRHLDGRSRGRRVKRPGQEREKVIRGTRDNRDRTAELLEKLLVFQLYALGARQDRIAKAVGRQKAWVNELLKGLPKGGPSDATKPKKKTAKGRSRRR
jgi:hypothetical protein